MGYYLRVLSPNSEPFAASNLKLALEASALNAVLSGELNLDWNQLFVADTDGHQICIIERSIVGTTGRAREEIDEFQEEMENCFPKSGATWAVSYFKSVKTIYSFQILEGAYIHSGWTVIDFLKSELWNKVGGILQADLEGFSNEDGYHVVWQFSEKASGKWWVAVLQNEKWVKYEMDLADHEHRKAFFRGEVPAGMASIK